MFEQCVGRRNSYENMCLSLRWLQRIDSLGHVLLTKSDIEMLPEEMCHTDEVEELRKNALRSVRGRVVIAYALEEMNVVEKRVGQAINSGLVQEQPVRPVRYCCTRKAGTQIIQPVSQDWLDQEA